MEGNDLYNGTTDVVVTDGFVGNVALKVSEGVAELMIAFLKERVGKSTKSKMGYLLLSDVFSALAKTRRLFRVRGHAARGVDGVCIICHGKSNERAIKNAIIQAKNFVGKNLNEHIKDAMQEYASRCQGTRSDSMDYFLTEDQKEIKKIARRIAEERVVPVRAELDEKEDVPVGDHEGVRGNGPFWREHTGSLRRPRRRLF